MRNKLKMLLAVLDGKPTGMKGQSMVELTLTLPIFIIMLVGLVEVGWFANNYLILSDTVRTAGRFGSRLDPHEWTEGAEKSWNRLDCDFDPNNYGKTPSEYMPDFPTFISGAHGPAPEHESTRQEGLGFYDGIACSVIANMAPLELKDTEDDIIISVISYAHFPDCDFDASNGGQPCVKVTGRYPTGQNECLEDDRDPFDFIENGTLDEAEDASGFDVSANDGIRGYVFRGNKTAESAADCLGSDFALGDIEAMLQQSIVTDDEAVVMTDLERCFVPNYGLVLAEVWWNSYQTIGLPFMEWAGNPMRIHVWSIFPLPAATPDIAPQIELDYQYCETYVN